MALLLDNPELEQAVRALAGLTGESEEASVLHAVQEMLGKTRSPCRRAIDWAKVRAIQERVATMPVLDTRTEDEILGYNEHGLLD